MSGEEAVIQAYEHAVKMAQDVTRPAYESLQWAARKPRPMPLRFVNIAKI
jgi:hypothetical protein